MKRSGVQLVLLLEPGTGRDIYFTPDNQLDTGLFAELIQLNNPIHHPVVGDGDGTLSQFLCPGRDVPQPAGAVQQAVFGMQMKMDKRHHGTSLRLYSFDYSGIWPVIQWMLPPPIRMSRAGIWMISRVGNNPARIAAALLSFGSPKAGMTTAPLEM